MTKSEQIRGILRSHESVFTDEVAARVNSTQPLVFRVIRAMEEVDGEDFEKEQVGRRVSYRLLTAAESQERWTARQAIRERLQRRSELRRHREALANAKAAIEDATRLLDALISELEH